MVDGDGEWWIVDGEWRKVREQGFPNWAGHPTRQVEHLFKTVDGGCLFLEWEGSR